MAKLKTLLDNIKYYSKDRYRLFIFTLHIQYQSLNITEYEIRRKHFESL